MSIHVAIEENTLIQKQSKAGKPYYVQKAYAHLTEQDGSPKRYPEQIMVYPLRDEHGNSIPYPKGDYTLSNRSFSVERGYLQLGFPTLTPMKKQA